MIKLSWLDKFKMCYQEVDRCVVFHVALDKMSHRFYHKFMRDNMQCDVFFRLLGDNWDYWDYCDSDFKHFQSRIKMSGGGFQMPSAPGYQPAPYPPVEQQGFQPTPYPPVDQQPGSHMMQPIVSQVCWFPRHQILDLLCSAHGISRSSVRSASDGAGRRDLDGPRAGADGSSELPAR